MPDFIVDRENLKDAGSPLVPGSTTAVASSPLGESGLGQAGGGQVQGPQFHFRRSVGLFAFRADLTDETLGQHRPNGGGD